MFGFLRELFNPETIGKPRPQRAKNAPPTDREAQISAMQQQAEGLMTPERAELLRRAMEVRRAKQTILADLSDTQRQKLVAVALKKLLNEGRDGDKKD